jgi:hypothetical protein
MYHVYFVIHVKAGRNWKNILPSCNQMVKFTLSGAMDVEDHQKYQAVNLPPLDYGYEGHSGKFRLPVNLPIHIPG